MIIPFFITHAGCPHRCVFCDQRSITGQRQPVKPSDVASNVALHLRTKRPDDDAQIAFFGGTFTALPRELQKEYLDAARPFIESEEVESIRISTRPDAVGADILAFLKERRVGVIELGAQSMDDRVLALAERGHTAEDTARAAALIRERGFSLGIQLMPGLPGDSQDVFRDTVMRTIALRPTFVRLYPALVIRNTPLNELYRGGEYAPLSLEEAIAWCRDALARFREAGIPVVRIGLQPTEELSSPGTIAAGPHHPAFRQLVEASLYREKMRRLLQGSGNAETATFFVNGSDLSTARGQKNENLRLLRREFVLHDIRVLPDPNVERGSIALRDSASTKTRNVI